MLFMSMRMSGGARRTAIISELQSWSRGVRKRYMSLRSPGVFPPNFAPLPLSVISAKREYDGAIIDDLGNHTYGDLLLRAVALSRRLTTTTDIQQQKTAQVAILVPNDHRFVVCQWAAWLSNLCTVPLHHDLPECLLDDHIKDSHSELVLVAESLQQKLINIRIPAKNVIIIPERTEQLSVAESKLFVSNERNIKIQMKNRDAQILYTSGTTGPPKGVVATHFQLHAQFAAVASEWFLSPDDTILHHLPLHHTHGLVNGLLAPLYAGAKVHMLPKFSAEKVWEQLLSEESNVNVLMGVPTMYAKLISFAKENLSEKMPLIRDFLRLKLRLCTCGSAPLPDSLLKAWQDISGHMLLERYGMSEFGMALGNPLAEKDRTVGCVGRPFPGIRVRIARRDAYLKSGFRVLVEGDRYSIRNSKLDSGESGDLLVKGPQVFTKYLNRPEETRKAFTSDGWFITGDVATFVGGAFKILGRNSVDIIKSGGYKISALDVERVLLHHSKISEAIVVGIPDSLYGERIVAIVVATEPLALSEVQEFCGNSLPRYSLPTKLVFMESIPRNALGKVNKMQLKKEIFPRSSKEYHVI